MSGWTADDLAQLEIRRAWASGNRASGNGICAKASRRNFHKDRDMNKLEAEYATRLEALKGVGEIADYRFECVKLRLADRTFYTPDFMVLKPDGAFEMHEVKGFWEDDARVKIKTAAESFPFKFIAARKQKGAWVFEEF